MSTSVLWAFEYATVGHQCHKLNNPTSTPYSIQWAIRGSKPRRLGQISATAKEEDAFC